MLEAIVANPAASDETRLKAATLLIRAQRVSKPALDLNASPIRKFGRNLPALWRRLIATNPIILAAAILVVGILLYAVIRPYQVKVVGGAVVRSNLVTGEMVLCNGSGCFNIVEPDHCL